MGGMDIGPVAHDDREMAEGIGIIRQEQWFVFQVGKSHQNMGIPLIRIELRRDGFSYETRR
eukprot:12416037-Karenia_brevis.AAC.1